jgi:acyl-coenzyme A thioesterase PaaI-like protein
VAAVKTSTTAGVSRPSVDGKDGRETDSNNGFRGRDLRALAHPRCIACSPQSTSGLRLAFHDAGEGRVRATVDCTAAFEGYPGNMHGGIIATILDSAMTNCLFAQGHKAVTAELAVRFRAPLTLNRTAITEARATRDLFPLFLMEASLVQDGQTKATATAKFIVPSAI